MSIWGCGSPARYFQSAVAGGFIYADLRDELNTHLAPQALFIYRSPGHDGHCYKLSLLQAHWGRWRYTRLLWSACLFTVHVGSAPSPLSSGSFLTQPLLQAFPLQGCRAGLPLLPSPAGLFIYSSVRDCPYPPLWHSGHLPSLLQVFLLLLLFIQVFFSFFPGCGLVCPGGYADLAQGCLWEYRVLFSSPGCLLLSAGKELVSGGVGVLLVSPFIVEWGCYAWAGGVKVSEFCSSWWFFLEGASPASLQDCTLGSTLSASSL
jgi:hypothetical protein